MEAVVAASTAVAAVVVAAHTVVAAVIAND